MAAARWIRWWWWRWSMAAVVSAIAGKRVRCRYGERVPCFSWQPFFSCTVSISVGSDDW